MSRALRRPDPLLALLAFGSALVLYLRTLYPGLNGIGDTPKFQFVGAILGTPHPPGYPLYTLLSWVFAQLPFGNLAWRINLLSALAAALATAFLYLSMRRLDCGRPASLATALAFAFGRVLWSQATLAEVYALAAALLAALLVATLSWGASREPRRLELAVLLAALSLAHHTTVAMLAPALVTYVLVTDARAGLAPRFLARGVLLVALGLSPYLFILLRNWQAAPYLGARARTLAELWDVMRGASFEGRLFAFDLHALLTERVPRIGRILLGELTPLGALFALAGLVQLARARWRDALLLGLGGFALVLFALNYDVPDIDVFLVPAFVLLWPLAGYGLDRALRLAPAPAVAWLALALPLAQVTANYRVSDHHDRSFEMRYFKALFEALPARAAIAAESYTVDHMVLYELLGERAARDRDVVTIPSDPPSVAAALRKGYTVFAFDRTRDALAALGHRFSRVRLLDAPLDRFLAALPRSRVVLRAGSDGGQRFAAIGSAGEPAALERRGTGAVSVEAPEGAGLGAGGVHAPLALRAEAGAEGASVWVNGVELARTETGVAFAVVAPGGRVVEAYELDPAEGLRVPFQSRAFAVNRLVGPPRCRELGRGDWVDVTELAAGGRVLVRIDDHEPYDASVTLWLGSERSLAPRLTRQLGTGTPQLAVRELAGAALRRALAEGAAPALRSATHQTRVELRVNDEGESSSSTLDLTGLPASAWARADVDLKSPQRASLCAEDLGDAQLLAAPSRAVSLSFGEEIEPFLGAGWHVRERAGFRWTAEREADLLLPVASAGPVRLGLRAMPLGVASATAATLTPVVNGEAQPAVTLRPGWVVYGWDVTLGAGVNDVALRVDRLRSPKALGLGDDERQLGVALSRLTLARP
jgi:hypothetical protein